jgi:hypothetical protein
VFRYLDEQAFRQEMNDADRFTRILGRTKSRTISAVITFITPVGRSIKRNLRGDWADEANVGSAYGLIGGAGPFFDRATKSAGLKLAAGRLLRSSARRYFGVSMKRDQPRQIPFGPTRHSNSPTRIDSVTDRFAGLDLMADVSTPGINAAL